jgi:two-component system response regulator YesN
LRQAGYITSEAEDGSEALGMIGDRNNSGPQFDAIVLDIQMPKMTGLDLIDAARSQGIDMPPVIVISGYADDTVIAELRGKNYAALLHKPFASETIVSLVTRLVSQ